MSELLEHTEEHGHAVGHLDNRHKIIIAGVAVAAILGIASARRRSTASEASGRTVSFSPESPDSPTSYTPVSSGPDYTPVGLPTVDPGSPATPGNGSVTGPTVNPVHILSPIPDTKVSTVVTGPSAGSTTIVSAHPTQASPGLGSGGIDYNASTTTAAQKAQIASDQQKIASGDTSYINAQLTYTNTVIANRQAAGLNISDQVAYKNTLESAAAKAGSPIASGATAPVVKPASGVGSNQYQYLSNLAKGSDGNAAWAKAQLAAGKF